MFTEEKLNILKDYLLVYNPSATNNLTVPLPLRFTNTSSLLNRVKATSAADPFKLEVKIDGTFYSMNSHSEFTSVATKLDNLGIILTPYFIRNMSNIQIGSTTTSLTTDIFIGEDRDSTTLLTISQRMWTTAAAEALPQAAATILEWIILTSTMIMRELLPF